MEIANRNLKKIIIWTNVGEMYLFYVSEIHVFIQSFIFYDSTKLKHGFDTHIF